MYLKLNFNNTVSWSDVFNIMRFVLKNNVTTINAITIETSIAAVTRGYINEANSEIYRTVSPGIGYGAPNGIWGYNWPLGTTTTTPEIVIKRKVSTYTGSDTEGDYYIRLRFDSNHLYTGCYRETNGLSAGEAGINSTFSYANGEESISGYNMSAGLTSLFWYITPTSMMIGGKGPTGSYTSTGWITPAGTRIANQPWTTSSLSMSLQSAHSVIADGARIYFQPPTSGGTSSAPGAISTTAGSYYYARNAASPTFSVAQATASQNGLANLHTGTYIGNVASNTFNDIIVEGLLPHNNDTNTVGVPPIYSTSGPFNGAGTISTYTISVTSASGIAVGQSISPVTNVISSGTIVTGINGTSITISQPLLSTITAQPLTFIKINVAAQAHFGPSFVSEFKPYDANAIVSNDYVPVMYSVGYIRNAANTGSQRAWYGMNSQDFLYADPYHTSNAYKVLSIQTPTPNLTGTWTTTLTVPVYIGTDLRTIERAPLGDSNVGTNVVTDRTLGAALVDQPGYKFPDENLQPSYGLFPLVWSASNYNIAGGKLTQELAGFMLFNGKYDPDDYFTYSGTSHALWPLADGNHRNIGIAVPKK